ncbi:DNA-directed RNA polymerase subunit beta [Candidatus Vidania fulgoroideorum]
MINNLIISNNIFIRKHIKIFPPMLKIQKNSFRNLFCKKSIKTNLGFVFEKLFPIFSKNNCIKINYVNIFIKKKNIKYTECLEEKSTYSFRIYIVLDYFVLSKIYEIKKIFRKKYLLCNIPIMLLNSSFLINGLERTVVSQLVKSPGLYFEKLKNGDVEMKLIPQKGNWIDFIIDRNKTINFRINKKKKVNIMVLFRCFKIEINDVLNSLSATRILKIENSKIFIELDINYLNKKIKNNIYDDNYNIVVKKNSDLNLKFKKIFIFLDKKFYDKIILSENFYIGKSIFRVNTRFNYNKFIYLNNKKTYYLRVFDFLKKNKNKFLFNSFFIKKNYNIENSYNFFFNYMNPGKSFNSKISNSYFDNVFFNKKNYYMSKYVRNKLNEKIHSISTNNFLTKEDIIKIVVFLLNFNFEDTSNSDIDSLENKRVKGIGQFIFDIFERRNYYLINNLIDRISKFDNFIDFKNLINSKILYSYIKEFFCVSQHSQFLDQNNILSEITHKRRISSIIQGNFFSKGRVSNSLRDIHFSNYGRICPIETPEGKNIGLVNSFAVFANINKNLIIETPYLKIFNQKIVKKIYYLDYFNEFKSSIIGIYNFKKNYLPFNKISIRRFSGKINYYYSGYSNFTNISSVQIFSLASLMIPFMQNNDANRALMGSNMQRQSIVSILPSFPYVSTGLENLPALDLGNLLYLKNIKDIFYIDSKRVIILKKNRYFKYKIFNFNKFIFSNQRNIINNRINIKKYKKNLFLINDNSNTVEGKISLGQNILAAFIVYEGYNFEDSIIVSERIAKNSYYDTLHYNEIVLDFKSKKDGVEVLNKDYFYINKNNYSKLDKKGLAIVGLYYQSGEVIAAKITPSASVRNSPEEKLITTILNKNIPKYRESFLKLNYGVNGILVKIDIIYNDKRELKEGYKNCNPDCYSYIEILKNYISSKICYLNNKYKKIKSYIYISDDKIYLKKKICNSLFYEILIFNNRINIIKKKIKKFSNLKGYFLGNNIYKRIKLTFVSKRRLSIGDKMSGRHGNKGVVSKILPVEDMPFANDGTRCDVILNPLGIPSRMNLGQLYEINLGFIMFGIFKRLKKFIEKKNIYKIKLFLKKIGFSVKINKKYILDIEYYKKTLSFSSIPFEGACKKEIYKLTRFVFNKKLKKELLINSKCNKIRMFNGKTGLKFNNSVSFGYIYFLKLHHISYDKIHSRSIGPYSLITQQPLKGKSRTGGQRFGEMEVWALEAYGAAYILQELLTTKSDDVKGRKKNYENISLGIVQKQNYFPESFNILLNEIKSLCLNVKLKI